MATRKSRTPTAANVSIGISDSQPPVAPAGGTTGRFLVVLREDAATKGVSEVEKRAGIKLARSRDVKGVEANFSLANLADGEGMVFDELGVMVVNSPPEQLRGIGVAAVDSPVLAVEPERIVYALSDRPVTAINLGNRSDNSHDASYLRGYRDSVNHLIDRLLREENRGSRAGLRDHTLQLAMDQLQNTWGLQATNVVQSRFTGRGIRVAVLDTGFDDKHPDFLGRTIVGQSFVSGETSQDGHGHGTHCIGTSCGPQQASQPPRYGIAFDAEIYAGKVLNNMGIGVDGDILAGINWAVANNCSIVSMSLGAPTEPGQPSSTVYEQAAARALVKGTLIVAAAGNESKRPGMIAPVGHPANCPSILAVAAVDASMQVAWFSCGGTPTGGGQVDICGPGVDVDSAWPSPRLRNTISGTSMATPHVAGIAALYAEAFPGARGAALWALLTQRSRRLPLTATDIGAGLVQAP